MLLWLASAGIQISGRRSVLKFAAAGLSAAGAGVQRAAGAEGLQQAADAYQSFDRALVAQQKKVAAPLVDAKQRGDAKIAEQGKKFSATMEKLNNCQVFRPVGDGGGCALTNGQQVFAFRDVLCHNCEGALGAGPKERTTCLRRGPVVRQFWMRRNRRRQRPLRRQVQLQRERSRAKQW